MAKEIKEEALKLAFEDHTITPKWKEGFLSVLKKNEVSTDKSEQLLNQNIPKTDDKIDDYQQLEDMSEQGTKLLEEMDQWKLILDKKKVTALNSADLDFVFSFMTKREQAFNILDLKHTNKMQKLIIELIKKDKAFSQLTDLESFDLIKVGRTNDLYDSVKTNIGLMQKDIDDFVAAKPHDSGLITNKLVLIVTLYSDIEQKMTRYKTSIQNLITETLSAQWGDESDQAETKTKTKTTRMVARRAANPKKSKAPSSSQTTKVKTTHALCQAQNLINDICDEYYALVEELFDDSPIPPANYHSFGTLIFDLFSFDGDAFSEYEKNSLLETRYAQAADFKASVVQSAAKLEAVKKTIEGKETSEKEKNAELKGENIKPIRVAIQGFLNVLWVQVQTIDDYLGVQLSPDKIDAFKKSATKGVEPLWSLYKKKLQLLTNSISIDVSSAVDTLKPHWQRAAIAQVNKQARNFLDVVESYTHILIRAPRLMIDTKKARFELSRIVNRIELGVTNETEKKLETTEAVFTLIKGVANTSMEVAALAAAASGTMVSGGMSRAVTAGGSTGSTDLTVSATASSSEVPLGKIDLKTDGIFQGVENLCTLGAKQKLREVQIIVQQAYNSLSNDLTILQEMLDTAQSAQEVVLGKEERWLPQMDIERFEQEGRGYIEFIAGVWTATGLLNTEDGASTPGKLERDNLRAKTNETKAITALLEKPDAKVSVLVSQ